jgi:hypothetical protein
MNRNNMVYIGCIQITKLINNFIEYSCASETVVKVVTAFVASYGTQRFITVSTLAGQLSLSILISATNCHCNL